MRSVIFPLPARTAPTLSCTSPLTKAIRTGTNSSWQKPSCKNQFTKSRYQKRRTRTGTASTFPPMTMRHTPHETTKEKTMNDKELTHDDFCKGSTSGMYCSMPVIARTDASVCVSLRLSARTVRESVSGATSSSSHSMGSAVASHPGRRNTTSFRSSRNTRIFCRIP